MFKSKRHQETEAEVERLREIIARAGGEGAPDLAREVVRLQHELAQLRGAAVTAQQELATVQAGIVETRETALLQEVGIYEYRHPLDEAVAYKGYLEALKDQVKGAVKQQQAVAQATHWTVNGSEAQGRKMVRDFSKLMLRAYNNEADHLIRTMKPYKLNSAVIRLGKTRDTIARLGKTMSIMVTDYYHRLRVYELELTADYLAKVAEEKERAREERERLREERKAMQELKREEQRLEKERDHRASVLAQLEAAGAAGEEIAQARASLDEVQDALDGVLFREANVRAGYVYVISNVGAFGPDIVKVGMTRRLEPRDRVYELGDASVPFRFDVHTLIFSEDAVGLENELHAALADRRVNLVNQRREYFYTTPEDVRDLLVKRHGQVLHFETDFEALEWRQSSTIRKQLVGKQDATAIESERANPTAAPAGETTMSGAQEPATATAPANNDFPQSPPVPPPSKPPPPPAPISSPPPPPPPS